MRRYSFLNDDKGNFFISDEILFHNLLPLYLTQTRSELQKDSNRHVLFYAIVMLVCAIPESLTQEHV